MQTPNLTPNALTVLKKRYLQKDVSGNVTETPENMFRRVADAIAEADRIYDPKADINATADKLYNLMASLDFLPNSPTLMNAGKDKAQLAACFVLPIEDSMESIFDAIKNTAMIHKTGGGTGFSFSHLRPKNDTVQSTQGISSGPVSFMRVFDAATEAVRQGGKRRGASLGLLRIDHVDIEEFIHCKRDGSLTNFNISVGVTDAFMGAVKADQDWPLINPRTGEVVREVSARLLFDQIVDGAWINGDPGLIFLDAMNRANPTQHIGIIEGTNPCGEQPLISHESCNLGSINLANMYDPETDNVNWEHLCETVQTAVHFLDNVIDVNHYPLSEIREMTLGNRKIGLGVMGFADLLIKMGIPYDSGSGLCLGEEIMRLIQDQARRASAVLGNERGNFPNYKGSTLDNKQTLHMRNATTTTIAPTGTLSIIAGCSSGIEPLFAVGYERREILDGDPMVEMHPIFLEDMKKEGIDTPELLEHVAKSGSLRNIEEIPDDIKRIFITAHDIDPEWHVKMQAAFQKYTDNAVSKTINMRHDATQEDVRNAYLLAHELGCKGITIYRDRSRDRQVLNTNTVIAPLTGSQLAHGDISIPHIQPRDRPVRTNGITERIKTGCGTLYVTLNEDERGYCEVFAQIGKAGGCASAQTEMAGRLISLALRSGIGMQSIVRQLKGIRCPSPVWDNGKTILSCSDAIGTIMEQRLDNPITVHQTLMGACPDCGGTVEPEGGCLVCRGCGFSRCA